MEIERESSLQVQVLPKKKKKLASAKPCCSAASAELACRDALSKRQQISRERERREKGEGQPTTNLIATAEPRVRL